MKGRGSQSRERIQNSPGPSSKTCAASMTGQTGDQTLSTLTCSALMTTTQRSLESGVTTSEEPTPSLFVPAASLTSTSNVQTQLMTKESYTVKYAVIFLDIIYTACLILCDFNMYLMRRRRGRRR